MAFGSVRTWMRESATRYQRCYSVIDQFLYVISVRLNSKAQPLKLELHTNRKMFKRQYRLSEPDKVEMGKQIKQMEEAGVIDRSSSSYYNSPTYLVLFMVALCNRADHYIFMLWFVLSSSFFFLFFPRLISAVGDWMFTILWHMVWPQCEFRMQV